MLTCASVPTVKPVDPDKRLPAHKMPVAMANEAFLDVVETTSQMQKAIYIGQPDAEAERLREIARAQFEAYLDLMAQAAVHVRALRP